MAEETQGSQNIQANENSIAVGSVSVGGSIDGSLIIGSNNVVNTGFSTEEVSVLITQISTTFQPKPFDGRSPYKGLDAFQEKDVHLFFGREKLVDDLTKRVKESRMIFVTGSSGSGKSSLVRAGLIPKLKKAGANSEWLYATMKPGRDPFGALATAFSRMKDPSLGKYFSENAGQPHVLQECAESALTDDEDQRLVLFIDQFEEVFTQLSRDTAETFINLLAYAATVEKGRIILLASMRSDFIPHCQTYPKLNTLLGEKYAFAPIGAMQPDELVSAIAQPAMRVGLKIDPELISQIINDMQGEPGALPLMQFALKDLFDTLQAAGGVIDLRKEGYIQRGGIHKALERHADDSFNKLSEREQELAWSIFSGLIEIGDGSQYTRRIAKLDELIPDNAKGEEIELIVRKLADARLVTTDNANEKITVTISHEKLISAWGWLKKLVDENRDVIAVKNEIINDAAEWDQNQRDDSFLYRGARLANARERLQARQLALSGLGLEFIQAAEKSYMDALEQEKQRADHLEHLNRTSLARLLTAQAQSMLASENSKQMTAVLLATQSMKLAPSAEASGVVLNSNFAARPIARLSQDEKVEAVLFSPDNSHVVSKGGKTVYVWDSITGREGTRLVHNDVVWSVTFTSDGKFIQSVDCTAGYVWEITTGRQVKVTPHNYQVESAFFSLDGKSVLMENWNNSESDKIVHVWDPATGKEISSITLFQTFGRDVDVSGDVNVVAFSRDGSYLSSGGYNNKGSYTDLNTNFVEIWDARTGKSVKRMVDSSKSVGKMAFSMDNKYLATGSGDTIQVWEVATGKKVSELTEEQYVSSVAFSPDNRYVIAIVDKFIHVWETKTGRERLRLSHDFEVMSAIFSPNGRYIVSGSKDKTARVWDASTGREIARLTHDHPVKQLAFSHDSKNVISADANFMFIWKVLKGSGVVVMRHEKEGETTQYKILPTGTYANNAEFILAGSNSDHLVSWREQNVRVWDADTGTVTAKMTHKEDVHMVTLSRDGRYVISGCQDKVARVWDVSTGRQISSYSGEDYDFDSLAYSPKETYVLTWLGYKTIKVWEASTGRELSYLNTYGEAEFLAISPDEKFAATVQNGWDEDSSMAHGDTTAHLWDMLTGREIASLPHDDLVTGLSFSPDSRYALTISQDKTVRVWDVSEGTESARLSNEHSVKLASYGTEGKILILSEENTVQIWEPETGKVIAQIPNDFEVNSVKFFPDGKYFIAQGNNVVRVCEVTTGNEMAFYTSDSNITAAVLSPDLKHIIIQTGSNVQVHKFPEGGEVLKNIAATLAQFSPDSRYVVSAGEDKIARVWEIAAEKEITRMPHEQEVRSVRFSMDGKFIISQGGDTALVWKWHHEAIITDTYAVMPRNLTRAEWKQSIGDALPYQAVCPNLPIEPEPTINS